jgi:3-oxoadipate enol-lactonase/4-carboxymuconolactone decarboxylase
MWEREQVSDTNAETLQYRFDGPEDAPVLVLGPSLGTTWHMWDRQIPELIRQWRVLRYDLPGHGGAAAHPATSTAELADRLTATLDQLGIEHFGYAGCSIGGAIGLQLALRHPHRVASLALISAAARFGTPDAWRQTGVIVRANGLGQIAQGTPERWFTTGFRAAQGGIVDWAVQMVSTTDPGCYIAACEAMAAHDCRPDLDRITVPTLVLCGADDPVTPPADARVLVAAIPDARLAVVPSASHLVPVEQPAAVTDLLVRHFGTAWNEPPVSAISAALPARILAGADPAAGPADGAGSPSDGRPDPYENGIKVRREVLGDAHVDRAADNADDFTGDFQEFITRYAWGEVWGRPGLDRRTRSVITLTALVARGHYDELAFHTRAALRNGLSAAEIKEVLLHTAVYCGVPAANSAFAVAQRVIREETAPQG